MFSGEYRHSIDAKGRVIMPSKFRDMLGVVFYITKGLDGNLYVFSREEWVAFYEKLKTLPIANKSARAFSHLFLGSAVECEMDKQGRVLLPLPLRDYASIIKDVAIIGNGNKLEIWSSEKWNEYNCAIDIDEISRGFDDLGIMI